MCAIYGCFDSAEYEQLYSINKHRGNSQHSITQLKDAPNNPVIYNSATFELATSFPDRTYIVGHCQAPTSKYSSQQPAVFMKNILYHNGLIPETECARLIESTGYCGSWDTGLLLHILRTGYPLSDVAGSFACFAILDDQIKLFRNQLAPMYIRGFSISSTYFDGAEMLPANVMYSFDPWRSTEHVSVLNAIDSEAFTTKDCPYELTP